MYFARRLYILQQTYRCATRFLLVISSAKGDVCSSAASRRRVLPSRQVDVSETFRAPRDIHDTRDIVLLRQSVTSNCNSDTGL